MAIGFRTYVHKMQTLLLPEQATDLIDVYGADFFTEINIRDKSDISSILRKSIQLPHGEGELALKCEIQKFKDMYQPDSIMVELIKK